MKLTPKTVPLQRSGLLRGLTLFPEVGLIMMILVAGTVFTFISPAFASLGNAESLLRTIAFVGIIVIGQAILLIVGELDLSVGSVAGMAAIVAGLLMTSVGLPIPLAMLIAVACGACSGFINGVLTTKAGIPSFVVTLSMLFVAKGIGYVLSGGDPVYPLPPGATLLAKTDILGLPSSVWILLILVFIFDQIMRRASWGRIAYATGGNARTSRFAGIDTDRVKIAAFVLTGSLAAFAGVVLTSRLGRADPSIGLGWELIVLAAAVVGGIRLSGGAGTIAGAFLGLLFLQVIQTGLVFSGVDAVLQPVVSGTVLVLAVAYDVSRRST
jgi:ribose transport system permease protein